MKAKILILVAVFAGILFLGIGSTALAAPEQPLLQIDSVTFSPETVSPGKEFTMTVNIRNHGNKAAYNVTLDVLSMSGAPDLGIFSMTGSGSHFFIENISAAGTAAINISMVPSPNAEAKNYNLNLNLSCANSENQVYAFAETVGIFINESNSMSIVIPDRIEMGAPDVLENSLKFEIANFGANSIRGVQLSLIADGVVFNPDYQYYGTFEKDDSDNFSTSVVSELYGEVPIRITLKYMDSFNNERMTERIVTLVFPPEPEEPEEEMIVSETPQGVQMPEMLKNGLKIFFGIGA